MESQFDILEKQYRADVLVLEGSDNPDLQNYNGLPEPFTEVVFKADALKDPYISSRDSAFQERVKKYIQETHSENRKYRLLISSVNTVRNSLDFAGNTAALGHIAQIVEQEGPVTKGHFTVPLSVLEYKNAAWNANQAPIPSSWRYDRFKHKSFADLFDEYNKGKQPKGTLENGGNN